MNTPDSDPVVEPRFPKPTGKKKLDSIQLIDTENAVHKLRTVQRLLESSFPMLSMRVSSLAMEITLQIEERRK